MKPKVLFILHLPPPIHGASIVGSYIKESELINQDFSANYINLATNKILKQSGKASLLKFLTFFGIVFRLLKSLVQTKYDLCYLTLTANGLGFYKDAAIILILKCFRKKIVYHFHNKGVAGATNTFLSHCIYKFALRNTYSILLSHYLYSDIEKFVKQKDVYYCPYGIPAVPFFADLNRVQRVKADSCQLLFLSNMISEKGVYVLLDACKQLKLRNLDFECHFVGAWSDISEEQFNFEISTNGLSDVVFAHGPKYNSDKFSFYNNSDIFLFPTYYHYETFGLVNLEAMQHGLAVVSTPEGGIPDIIVDGLTGFLVPQKNSHALADKLELLIQTPELRHKMGQAGKKRFDELFTLEQFERNLSSILQQIINR